MWEALIEGFGAALEAGANARTRWIRRGCVVFLLFICVALLTLPLWVPLL